MKLQVGQRIELFEVLPNGSVTGEMTALSHKAMYQRLNEVFVWLFCDNGILIIPMHKDEIRPVGAMIIKEVKK